MSKSKTKRTNTKKRDTEQVKARERLREDPNDAEAREVMAQYNPTYEGRTMQVGVGMVRPESNPKPARKVSVFSTYWLEILSVQVQKSPPES